MFGCRLVWLLGCIGWLFAAVAVPRLEAGPAEPLHAFDVPAGDAVDTLRIAARQAGVEIVFFAETVRGLRTPALRGSFTARQAITRLLARTGLVLVPDASNEIIRVQRADPAAPRTASAASPSTSPSARPRASGAQPESADERRSPHLEQPMNRKSLWTRVTGALALALAGNASAQTTTPSAKSNDDAALTLSPFVVQTDKDTGYAASNTLAGSRLNTELANTPAAISVFTKEFLDDIGALDVKQAIDYAMNTGPDTTDYTGNVVSSNALSFTMRGFVGASLGRNYFGWFNSADFYNTERIDMARGPNSILFGIGGPGGIVNTTTKQARSDRPLTQLALRVGSWDDYRATLDLNRPLGEKFAVRANLLWQDRKSNREFEFYERQGLALAATYRPFRQTTVRFDGEYGIINDNRAQPWPAADRISPWLNAGRPISQTFGQAVTGTSANASTYWVFSPETGHFRIQGSRETNAGPSAPSLGNNPIAITDTTLLPHSANLRGPGQINEVNYYNWAFFVEQRVCENFDVELAFNQQRENQDNYNVIVFDGVALRGDPNALIRVGNTANEFRPNPNVGKMYVEGSPDFSLRRQRRDDYRATASYQLDLRNRSHWLGSHRFAGMLSQRDVFGLDDRYRPVNVNPATMPTPSDWTNGNNLVRRRTYLDFSSGDPAHRGLHDPRANPLNDPNGIIERMVRTNDSVRDTRSQVDSRMLAFQSTLLDGRLWLTGGWRNDRQRSWGDGNAPRDPVTREWGRRVRNANADYAQDDTRTYGAVLHVLPQLSLYYNNASNFLPQSVRSDLIGGALIGNRFGKGRDAGIKVNLLKDKIRGTLGWYETSDTNRSQSIDSAWHNNINAIWRTLGRDDLVIVDSNDSQDLKGKGYEFELTANPTRNWRTTFNWSITQQVISNLQPRRQAYIAQYRPTWQNAASTVLVNTGSAGVPTTDTQTGGPATVATALRTADAIFAGVMVQEGQIRRGLREHQGNIFTNYSFTEGWLKGFGVGLGANYRGKGVVGYDTTRGNAHIYGDDFVLVNGMLNYQRKIWRGISWRLQLNVDNLLGEDELIVTDADNVRPYRFVYQTPRRWGVTSTFTF